MNPETKQISSLFEYEQLEKLRDLNEELMFIADVNINWLKMRGIQ